MSLVCRPWFRWGFEGEESELTLTYPQKPWKHGRGGAGGSATAASGIPEAYKIRRDRIVWLELRVLESEIPAFDVWLDWAQDYGEPFQFRFDTDDIPGTYSVYLHSPRWEDGEEVQYNRSEEYPGLFIIPIALRTELGNVISVDWHNLATLDDGEES